MKTTRQVLVEARALITNPKHWTQRVSARDVIGIPVPMMSPDACKFCATGAIGRVCEGPLSYAEAINLLSSAVNETPQFYNDEHTHAEVLAMFDRAIGLTHYPR